MIYPNYKSPAKQISRAVMPSGRIIYKAGSYSHVLVHKTTEFFKWSNSLAKLESEIDFLVNKCKWNREELLIIEIK